MRPLIVLTGLWLAIFLTVSSAVAGATAGPGGTGGGSGAETAAQAHTEPKTPEEIAERLQERIIGIREALLRHMWQSDELQLRLVKFLTTRPLETIADSYPTLELRKLFRQLYNTGIVEEAKSLEIWDFMPYGSPCYEVRPDGRKVRRPVATLNGVRYAPVCVDFELLAREFSPSIEQMAKFVEWKMAYPRRHKAKPPTFEDLLKDIDLVHGQYPQDGGGYINDYRKIPAWVTGLFMHELARHLGHLDDDHTFAGASAQAYANYATLGADWQRPAPGLPGSQNARLTFRVDERKENNFFYVRLVNQNDMSVCAVSDLDDLTWAIELGSISGTTLHKAQVGQLQRITLAELRDSALLLSHKSTFGNHYRGFPKGSQCHNHKLSIEVYDRDQVLLTTVHGGPNDYYSFLYTPYGGILTLSVRPTPPLF